MSQQPMTSATGSPHSAAGFYGKIPGAGDFVSRRVPQQTIFIWDDWLRHSLHQSKTQSDTSTRTVRPSAFERNTSWNFVLPVAVCGRTSIGIIAPSIDRVGRRFPFTIFKDVMLLPNESIRLGQLADFFSRHQSIIDALIQRNMNIDQLERMFGECATGGYIGSAASLPSGAGKRLWSMGTDGSGPADDILSILDEPADMSIPVAHEASCPPQVPWPDLLLADAATNVASYWWRTSAGGRPTKAFTHTGGLNMTLFNELFAR